MGLNRFTLDPRKFSFWLVGINLLISIRCFSIRSESREILEMTDDALVLESEEDILMKRFCYCIWMIKD